jgi:hypothetical protein
LHTQAIDRRKFSVRRNGADVSVETFLGWTDTSRLGIVVDAPFGGLGAGVVTGLAMNAFYDLRNRRSSDAVYPDFYLFHAGQRWGDHSMFDFWPDCHEVSVVDRPDRLLEAINAHAITHLLVPVAPAGPLNFHRIEYASATSRLSRCFAYAPGGSVDDGDVEIVSTDPTLLNTFRSALDPQQFLSDALGAVIARTDLPPAVLNDAKAYVECVSARLNEVAPDVIGWPERRASFLRSVERGALVEHLRQTKADEALAMLAGR